MSQSLRRSVMKRGVYLVLLLLSSVVSAQRSAPDAFIRELGDSLMARVQADPELIAGNVESIKALVDAQVIPNMAFERMTASTVGPAWRQATDAQREALQQEFKVLLVRTYAGAVKHIAGKSLVVLPVRMAPEDTNVTVKSEIRSTASDPVPLGYRLIAQGDTWVIYDVNVLGIWLVETYRTQFAGLIQQKGLDGLIQALHQLNNRS